MKKLALTIAIVLGLSMTTFADPNGGGLFQRGGNEGIAFNIREGEGGEGDINMPGLPGHGSETNEDATPLGSGVVVLLGLGAAYLVGKKRNEE